MRRASTPPGRLSRAPATSLPAPVESAAGAFDPNSASAEGSGVFGLPFGEKESAVVFLPVPWEATVSYGGGASRGPAAILEASRQLDLYDSDVDRPYRAGMSMLEEAPQVRRWNREARKLSAPAHAGKAKALARVNELGGLVNAFVRGETRRLLRAGKVVGVVGGDHSVPYGAIQAAAEENRSFGVLHFDAHHDMRDAFQGFRWSHASIMRNVLDDVPQVSKIVQVGIRDYCEEEVEYVRAQGPRAEVFYDSALARARLEGRPWSRSARAIVESLPRDVWISFDIDGLDPRFCPGTGTPVPGGLDFQETVYLLRALAASGRRVLGFDLVEVAPGPAGEWDANVGMRLLYKLAAFALASRGQAALKD